VTAVAENAAQCACSAFRAAAVPEALQRQSSRKMMIGRGRATPVNYEQVLWLQEE
jgi:hypothetical protein